MFANMCVFSMQVRLVDSPPRQPQRMSASFPADVPMVATLPLANASTTDIAKTDFRAVCTPGKDLLVRRVGENSCFA